ncbi:hypothetical protein ACT3KA_25380 [Escherichia coli]
MVQIWAIGSYDAVVVASVEATSSRIIISSQLLCNYRVGVFAVSP